MNSPIKPTRWPWLAALILGLIVLGLVLPPIASSKKQSEKLSTAANNFAKVSQQVSPGDLFQQLAADFKLRAQQKQSPDLMITVNHHFSPATNLTSSASGTIQVRKHFLAGNSENPKKTAEIIDLFFTYDTRQWRCTKALSQDLEGDKQVGQNSLEGSDIRLSNLLIWSGL